MSKATDAFAYALAHCSTDLGAEAAASAARTLAALSSLESSIDARTQSQGLKGASKRELTASFKERNNHDRSDHHHQ